MPRPGQTRLVGQLAKRWQLDADSRNGRRCLITKCGIGGGHYPLCTLAVSIITFSLLYDLPILPGREEREEELLLEVVGGVVGGGL